MNGKADYNLISKHENFKAGIDRIKDGFRYKPLYFYLVSLGRRYEFRVEYPEGINFELVEDLVPLI